MKKKKARHLWHGVFAFFILLSFFGAVVFLENQGSLITGFAVSEVSADSPITATLGIGIPLVFKWQGQEYSLRAGTISLSEGKVKACEAIQETIKKRSEKIVERAKKQEEVFTKISKRVEEFYANKLLPSGKIVANYDTLVADIASKEAAIAPLLEKANR